MNTTQNKIVRPNGYSSFAAPDGNGTAMAQLVGRQPEASVRPGLSAAVTSSPFIGAQRRALSEAFAGPAQRKGSPEKKLQGKFLPAQRATADKEKMRQGRFDTAQRVEAESGASSWSGLPDGLRSGVETLSGVRMDAVNVHYNSAKPAQLNALAYAQGSDIHLGPGQEKHLPHEAWHVAQQAQGRVRPTAEAGGVAINNDSGLESEADRLGARAAQMKTGAPDERKSSAR